MKNILVTGAAGFIGSNFAEFMVNKHPDYNIIVFDKLTYAGNMDNLKKVQDKITFVKGDICDLDKAAKRVWGEGSKNKFVHISTDEVYGTLGEEGYFTETSPIKPNSPYSASKASSDLIAFAYHETFKMNVSVTNCSNNYGPYQHNEKLIPHMIKLALKDEKLPVYGEGLNIRDWLYVEDHCEAIDLVLHNGKAGERYNIGGHNEKRNIEIVKLILKHLNKPESLIEHVEDRKGHDYRYAIDPTKIKNELGWEPKTKFEDGIIKTIDWYLENPEWLK